MRPGAGRKSGARPEDTVARVVLLPVRAGAPSGGAQLQGGTSRTDPHGVEGRSSAQPMAASQTQAWRVLIADEEAEVRSQLGGLLRGWDCEIWEAADGATAQEFLQQGVVDAAFVNAQLPGVSGWELFQTARDLPRQVPVILFTTTGTQGMEAEIMRTNTMQELTTHPVD